MPNGKEFEDEFNRRLLEWEAKAKLHEERVKPLETRSQKLMSQIAVIRRVTWVPTPFE